MDISKRYTNRSISEEIEAKEFPLEKFFIDYYVHNKEVSYLTKEYNITPHKTFVYLNSREAKDFRISYVKTILADQLKSSSNFTSKILYHLFSRFDYLTDKQLIDLLNKVLAVQEVSLKSLRLLEGESTENVSLRADVKDLMRTLKEKQLVPKPDILSQDLSRGLLKAARQEENEAKRKAKDI